MASELLLEKIILLIVVFGINFLGIIPIRSKYCKQKKNLLGLLNTFAAGVFLAMAFIHILPEAAE